MPTPPTHSIRSARAASRWLLIPGALLLCGMASVRGTMCAPTYPLEIDVPPRKAPADLRQMVVRDFAPPGWGHGFAQEVRGRLVEEGFVQPVPHGAGAVLEGAVQVSPVRRTPGHVTRQQTVEQNGREVTRNVTTYTVRSQAEVSVSYRLHRGGRLLASDTYGRSFDATAYGSNPNEARANAPTDDAILSSLLLPIVEEVVRDVSPHTVTRELELRIGGHPGLDQGATYMKNGRFEQAFAIWDQVAETAQTAEDRSAALYNMGVVREVRGEYDEAFQMFSEADALTPGDEGIIQALSRAEAAKAEQDVLRGGARTYRLTVRTDPPEARVRIMNIGPRYRDGIRLAPGAYDVLVDAPGYAQHREWIRIEGADEQIDVRLEPR